MFLRILSRKTCAGCGVGRATAHEHRYRFPEFAAAWEEALQKGVDRVYSTLLDHAINGVKKPVFHQGKKVGYTTEWDHRSMEWILARRRPAEFGDSKRIELSETRRTVMSPKEEEEAYKDAIQSITATIRHAAMKGIPEYRGGPPEAQASLLTI